MVTTLGVAALGVGPPDAVAQPPGEGVVGRLAGPSRIDTAVAIAQHAFPDGASAVYLGRADVFADALAAGALTDGPILLVPSCGDLPSVVAAEIGRLDPDRVVALGGEAAVCDPLLQTAAADRTADRLAGVSRTDTAVAIAQAAFPDGAATVYVADAGDSPDAVAGGALTDGPVLLVNGQGDDVAPSVLEEVARLDPGRVVALGGQVVVTDAVLQGVAQGRPTDRLAGGSRIETAAAIATAAFPAGAVEVYLARGDVFADAVAAGALTAGPVVLVPSCGELPAAVADVITRLGVDRVIGLGGEGAVCEALLQTAGGLVGGGNVVIPDTTVILDQAARDALVGYDPDGTLRFTAPAPAVAVGDVIVSDVVADVAPQGFLRRVTGVTQDGDTLVVTTEPATIPDAVTEGTGVLQVPLTPADIIAQEFNVALANPHPPTGDSEWDGVSQPLVNIEEAREREVAPGITVSGSFALTATLNAGVDVGVEGIFPPRPHVEAFNLTIDVEQSASLLVTATYDGAWADTIELFQINLRCFKIPLGYFPVLVCPELVGTLSTNGTIEVTVTMGTAQSAAGSLGVTYDDEDGWSPVTDRTFDLSPAPPPTFEGEAAARVGIRADLTFDLYDVTGPYLFIEGYGRGEAEANNTMVCWGLYGGLNLGGGFNFTEVPILGDTLDPYEITPVEEERLLAEHPSPHTTCAPRWVGTLQVDASMTWSPGGEWRYENEFSVSYSDLVRVNTASPVGHYQSQVTMSFTERVTGYCGWFDRVQLMSESAFSYSGPSTAAAGIRFVGTVEGVAFDLRDTPEGTYFIPFYAIFQATRTSYCSDKPTNDSPHVSVLSYQPAGATESDTPLVDTDPDPDRLVGTTTYDLSTIPGGARYQFSAYSYSVTYDLRRAE